MQASTARAAALRPGHSARSDTWRRVRKRLAQRTSKEALQRAGAVAFRWQTWSTQTVSAQAGASCSNAVDSEARAGGRVCDEAPTTNKARTSRSTVEQQAGCFSSVTNTTRASVDALECVAMGYDARAAAEATAAADALEREWLQGQAAQQPVTTVDTASKPAVC